MWVVSKSEKNGVFCLTCRLTKGVTRELSGLRLGSFPSLDLKLLRSGAGWSSPSFSVRCAGLRMSICELLGIVVALGERALRTIVQVT